MSLARADHDLPIATPWSLRPRVGVALLLALLPALLMLEWAAGRAFSLYLFYLVPIALAAWNFGYRTGFGIAVMAAAYCNFVALNLAGPEEDMLSFAMQGASILAMFLLFAFVIAHHRRFVESAADRSRLDGETGVLAQREFDRMLQAEAWRANRFGRPLSLVLLEADGSSTARLSREVFLARLGAVLGTGVRECDAAGRIGNRRFALLLVECSEAQAARVVARLRPALDRALGPTVPFSFGVASYPGTGATSGAILMRAAEAEMGATRGEAHRAPVAPPSASAA